MFVGRVAYEQLMTSNGRKGLCWARKAKGIDMGYEAPFTCFDIETTT
jgi:hypothetical protein